MSELWSRFSRLGCLLVISMAAGSPHAAQAAGDVAEVERCLEANTPETTSVQTVALTSHDRTGSDRTQRGRIFWKRFSNDRSRVFMQVEEPPDLRGSSYLIIEKPNRNDMFVYLPTVRKSRRINTRSASGSLFGTDFSYEDMERLQTLGSGKDAERLPDAKRAGRDVYVVASRPDAESGSAYERVVSFVDRETCVPLVIEFYEKGDSMRKFLTSDPDALRKEGSLWLPGIITMKDLKRESESTLVLEAVELGVEVPDHRFSQGRMGR